MSAPLYFKNFSNYNRDTQKHFLAACSPLLKLVALMRIIYYASKWGWVLVGNAVIEYHKGCSCRMRAEDRNFTLKLNTSAALLDNADSFPGVHWFTVTFPRKIN